ncbi:hypothetical protein EK21DRAFT_71842 [Setomelanomma holmii]|uniref:Uncharacterized protein n=1 Tax=Setomelanomma holmii TaxID=210430 RepID=A0A9P4H682_9PLEO|nr:hypothetical protein EK21DRAFT_71842 [Setomelanomma holmii]
MVRRSAGFVAKKAHRKSRGGCLTCKRKKVKVGAITLQAPRLHAKEYELLNHYKAFTWETFAIRGDSTTRALHRDLVPQMSISNSHLLYALLSLAASRRNRLQPSKTSENQALIYRQKTFEAYTKELQNITNDNYEPIVVTGTFLLALIPAPAFDAPDEEHVHWLYTLLKMAEGLRILASLRWGQGIEKLSIYPIICRELRTLPPPPIIPTPDKPSLHTPPGPLGSTPEHPNPPSTYDSPLSHILPFGSFVFLPPTLMSLLETTMNPPASGPLDLDRNTLVPVFHALSPIFLSLYYYHLNPDFNVRCFVFTSFLMPDFLALVNARETRALTLVTWWFALAALVPAGWWGGKRSGIVVDALASVIKKSGDTRFTDTFEGAVKLVRMFEDYGREMAAASIFEGWEGVHWEDGPRKAEEWEAGLMADLDFEIGLGGLDIGLDQPARSPTRIFAGSTR